MASIKGTILITGSNGGLGSAISRHVASQPKYAECFGLYTVRDTAAPILRDVLSSNPSHAHQVVPMDLTDLDSVRRAAETINIQVESKAVPPIRALILNAGFQDFGNQVWTADGLDKTFSANYLGHWLFTLLVLESMDKEAGRIVLVGSQSHDPFDERNKQTGAFVDERFHTFIHDSASFEAIAKGMFSPAKEDPSWRSGFRRYGAAKLFSIMTMYELQRRMNKDPDLRKICILGVDPGTMSTGIQRHAPWFIRVLLFQIIYPIILAFNPNGPIRSTEKSASDVVHAAFDSSAESGESPKGLYYFNSKPLETSTESKDPEKQSLVWKETVQLAQLKKGETVLEDWQ